MADVFWAAGDAAVLALGAGFEGRTVVEGALLGLLVVGQGPESGCPCVPDDR